ncbi:MAG: LysE family transporter [Pseudomonadota bacterium]
MIGFSIAAPVGPIGVLCIRRTLSDGRAYGIVSGLGAAAADAVYGCIAGFGLTFVSNLLIEQQRWLRLGGGIFLCYLGLRTFLSRPHSQEAASGGNGLFSAFASTFFLTLTNPITIISFAAIFTGLGIVSAQGDYFSAGILVAGVFLGSGLWWFILSGIVSFFRTQFDSHKMGWINRLAGIVIAGFGLLALFNTI